MSRHLEFDRFLFPLCQQWHNAYSQDHPLLGKLYWCLKIRDENLLEISFRLCDHDNVRVIGGIKTQLDQLNTFCKVVESQTFSAAARRLYLSQPAVSLQMQRLERNIGRSLFSRTRPTIQLTPVGEALYSRAVNILEELRAFETELRHLSEPQYQRPLTIGAGMLFGDYILPHLLEELKTALPNMPLVVEVDHGEVLLNRLQRSEVDFLIAVDIGIPPDLIVDTLLTCDLFVTMSPQHPFAAKETLSERDLLRLCWILPPVGKSWTRMLIDNWSLNRDLKLNVIHEIRHYEAIKQLIKAGLGESLLFWPVIADEVGRGELVTVKIESPPHGTISAIRSKDKLTNFEMKVINIIKKQSTRYLVHE